MNITKGTFMFGSFRRCVFVILSVFIVSTAIAEPLLVGHVSFSRGSNAASQSGQIPRLLGKGSEIFQQDNIQTSERSFVMIKFVDGAKITIRPNSSFTVDHYSDDKSLKKAEMTLHKGGIRTQTGKIAENSPNAYQIKTADSVVKAQQADYSIRLCAEKCVEENKKYPQTTSKLRPFVVARIVEIKGQVSASSTTNKNAPVRKLSVGSPLYSQDQLNSAKDSYALLVFRDGGRISMQESSAFNIAKYHFEDKKQADHAGFSLIKGGLRALSGSIGKKDKAAYGVDTPVATIGIRGTGFDLISAACPKAKKKQAPCLYSQVWQGLISQSNGSGDYLLAEGETNVIKDKQSGPVALKGLPGFIKALNSRPDENQFNMQNLFGSEDIKETPFGTYVAVHKGHLQVQSGINNPSIDLGRNEVSFVDIGSKPVRLQQPQAFQLHDPYSLPPSFNAENAEIGMFSLLGDTTENFGGHTFQCACD